MSDHPELPGRLTEQVQAGPGSWTRTGSESEFSSDYLSLTTDTIVAPDGSELRRLVVHPRAAVGVIATDAHGRILLVEQYRHPMGRRMLEIPAGLMDVAGESALETAQRELLEETDVRADTWKELFALAPTVGYSTETITIFRATDLHPVDVDERVSREAEEADLTPWWVDPHDALAAVFDGRIADAKTVAAILAVTRT